MNDIVPRTQVAKQGVQGVVSLAGGIGAFVLAGVTVHPIVGILVGGALTLVGLALSGAKHERGLGVVTTVAGAATLAASLPFLRIIFGGLVHGVLVGTGIVLVGVGAYSLFRFLSNLRKRS